MENIFQNKVVENILNCKEMKDIYSIVEVYDYEKNQTQSLVYFLLTNNHYEDFKTISHTTANMAISFRLVKYFLNLLTTPDEIKNIFKAVLTNYDNVRHYQHIMCSYSNLEKLVSPLMLVLNQLINSLRRSFNTNNIKSVIDLMLYLNLRNVIKVLFTPDENLQKLVLNELNNTFGSITNIIRSGTTTFANVSQSSDTMSTTKVVNNEDDKKYFYITLNIPESGDKLEITYGPNDIVNKFISSLTSDSEWIKIDSADKTFYQFVMEWYNKSIIESEVPIYYNSALQENTRFLVNKSIIDFYNKILN